MKLSQEITIGDIAELVSALVTIYLAFRGGKRGK